MPGTVLFRCREPHGAPGGRCSHPHFMGEMPEVTRLIVGARVRQLPSFALSHCAGPFSGSKVQGCLPWCLWSPAPGGTGAPVEQENGGALDSARNRSLRGPWLCPTRSPGRSGVSAWGGTWGAGFGFHHSAPDAGAVRPLLDALQKAGPRGAWKGDSLVVRHLAHESSMFVSGGTHFTDPRDNIVTCSHAEPGPARFVSCYLTITLGQWFSNFWSLDSFTPLDKY